MEQTIHKQMTIGEIFTTFPSKSQKLAQAMTNAGLHCTSCSASSYETLEAGVLGHGYSDKQLEKLLNELNAILQEKDDLSTISLTKKAADKFKEFATEEGEPTSCLRFGDSAGGCGGFQYILDFCSAPTGDDVVFESFGVKICVHKGAVSRLIGSTIDFVDGLQGAGFKVSNPNVRNSCACGTSQSY